MHEKIGVISLGCTKNRVDTENMLTLLHNEGYAFTDNPQEADALIINTCGFIQDAKEESINTILEMAQLKENGNLKALVVTGCLSQRYQQQLIMELPEVDAFLGVGNYQKIAQTVKKSLEGGRYADFEVLPAELDYGQRILTTPPYMAYIKIAEGCDNCCTYCVIPTIRGSLRSRAMEDIVSEAKALASRGVKEVILIAQDTTQYGVERYNKPMINELLQKIAAIGELEWLRVLYSYPEGITDEFMDTILKNEKICHYIDIPVQHLDDGILKSMNRRSNRETIFDVVRRVREKSRDMMLRTTIITGFPGETEEQHKILLDGLKELRFDRLGVFKYSREEGTKAAYMENQVHHTAKQRRYNEIMRLQAGISEEKNKARVGKTYRTLIEGFDEVSGYYYGRSYAEVPDIDGKIFLNTKKNLTAGMFHDVVITEAYDYDLLGEIKNECCK